MTPAPPETLGRRLLKWIPIPGEEVGETPRIRTHEWNLLLAEVEADEARRAAASGGERETDVVAMYGAVFDDGSLWDQLFFTPEAAQRYIDNECSADGVMRVERVWPLAALRASGEREKDADPMTYNKVLRELGARLADLLDADHWNNIEPMLHALASSGERDGEVTPEDRAWLEREATRIERNVAEYEASGNAELVIGAKTIAPTAARWRRILAALSSRQETP